MSYSINVGSSTYYLETESEEILTAPTEKIILLNGSTYLQITIDMLVDYEIINGRVIYNDRDYSIFINCNGLYLRYFSTGTIKKVIVHSALDELKPVA